MVKGLYKASGTKYPGFVKGILFKGVKTKFYLMTLSFLLYEFNDLLPSEAKKKANRITILMVSIFVGVFTISYLESLNT